MSSLLPLFGTKKGRDDKYQGAESYGDAAQLSTGVMDDLKAIGIKGVRGDVQTLLDVALAKGKPVDDKQMTVRQKAPSIFCRSSQLTCEPRWKSSSP
jgi:hypothetical protein